MSIFSRVVTFAREEMTFVEKLAARIEAIEAFLESVFPGAAPAPTETPAPAPKATKPAKAGGAP